MHERCDIEGHALLGGAFQRKGPVLAFGNANAAPHASLTIDMIEPLRKREGVKLTKLGAFAARRAASRIDRGGVSGGGKHRRSVSVRLHCPAAAIAAIADGIEPAEHHVLEERMMNMTALVLRLKDPNRLGGRDSPGS